MRYPSQKTAKAAHFNRSTLTAQITCHNTLSAKMSLKNKFISYFVTASFDSMGNF